MTRLAGLGALVLASWLALDANPAAAGPPEVHVYKSATCSCCQKWVEHLRKKGYEVTVSDVPDVRPVKRDLGVPPAMSSCHTASVGNYFIEGHVPEADIARLLAEHPDIAGLAVPGMPIGSPGMEGPNPQAYSVFAVGKDGKPSVFAKHEP
jgi:hypothetical protein